MKDIGIAGLKKHTPWGILRHVSDQLDTRGVATHDHCPHRHSHVRSFARVSRETGMPARCYRACQRRPVPRSERVHRHRREVLGLRRLRTRLPYGRCPARVGGRTWLNPSSLRYSTFPRPPTASPEVEARLGLQRRSQQSFAPRSSAATATTPRCSTATWTRTTFGRSTPSS